MNKIVIKEAMPEDAEMLIAYTKQVGGETDNLTFDGNGFPITIEQEARFLQKTHDDKHSIHLLAWKDNRIVGDGSLSGFPRRMSHRAELGLTVSKAEWNKGVGSLLMEKLIEYARNNEIEVINLEVRNDNKRAIHLYEKFGFRIIGTLPAYFKIGREYVDFILMFLDLR